MDKFRIMGKKFFRLEKKIKILVLTSTSLRHLYFIEKLSDYFANIKVLTVEKSNYYEKQIVNSEFIKDHFKSISSVEKKIFKLKNDFPRSFVKKIKNVNDSEVINFAHKEKFDLICLFGTEILNDQWLINYENKIVNLHLGLSPFYRGSATLFWPFYFDELQFLGSTIHLAVKKVDAGKILKRVLPSIREKDDYYNITAKLIKRSINCYPSIVASYLGGKIIPFDQEDVSLSRLCKKSDFNDEALSKVVRTYSKGVDLKIIRTLKANYHASFNN